MPGTPKQFSPTVVSKTPVVSSMKEEIKLGIYKHFKGKYYLVLGIAKNSETEEKFVVYVPLYVAKGTRMFVRPHEMFLETVNRERKKQPRFTYVGQEVPENSI